MKACANRSIQVKCPYCPKLYIQSHLALHVNRDHGADHPGQKWCSHCGEWFAKEFMKYGQSACKRCHSKRSSEWAKHHKAGIMPPKPAPECMGCGLLMGEGYIAHPAHEGASHCQLCQRDIDRRKARAQHVVSGWPELPAKQERAAG